MLGQFKFLRVFSLSAVAFASGSIWVPDISEAGDGFGMAMGIMQGMMRQGGGGGYRHRYRGGGGGGGDSSPNNTDSKKQENQNAALRAEALSLAAANENSEASRNVDTAIKEFIDFLVKQHQEMRRSRENVRASTGSNINQITEGEIRIAIEKAYQETRLNEFDRLAGELWTHDRLVVLILREGKKKIDPYFKGVGAKGPDVTNLQDALKEAAASVYAQALELAEIIGVSRSFDHFIRTIYENSDQAPANLWTVGADVQYERMITRVITEVDRSFFTADRVSVDNQRVQTLSTKLSRQFDFRFRARRALYDCLSAGYVSLISKGTPAAPQQFASKPNGSRGAILDLFSRPEPDNSASKPGNPKVIAIAEVNDTSEDVWKRAREWVSEKCKEITKPMARQAAESGLAPISARTDLAVAAGLAIDRTQGQYLKIRTEDPR
jgi:hypothetical protein